MSGQSRRHSLVETAANIGTGYAFSLAVQLLLLPSYGCHLALADNIGIGLIFTVASLVRSFCWRRYFNTLQVRRASS